jgi:hypothetical protein
MVRRILAPASSRLLFPVLCIALCAASAPAQSSESAAERSAGGPAFVAAPAMALKAAPTSVAAGDVNGDGKLDLVLTTQGSAKITVLLGDGNGGFTAAGEYAAGARPGNVLLADLTGSGRFDAIVTDAATGAIEVLRGNGDGSFGKPESFNAIANPLAIAAGNFGGKGKADLAAASAKGVAVLLNDGTGEFGLQQSIALDHPLQSLTAADLKGSGHDDLIAANADGTVTVLANDSNGGFHALAPVKAAPGALAAAVAADFNHDGRADLAVTLAGSNQVMVLLGRGDGSFEPAVAYRVGNNPASILAASLKGDGIVDLVTANAAANTFSVLMGKGDGSFLPAADFVAGNTPVALASGDFNQDGHADLAVLNSGDKTVSLPLGRGDGSFQAALSYRTGLEQKSIAAGDLNGDGLTDLVVSNFCGEDTACKANGTATVMLATKNGAYRQGATYDLGAGPVAIALADLNGSNKLDLIAVNRSGKTLMVLPGKGDGAFGEPEVYPLTASPRALYVGSFGSSGRPGLAIASDCGRSTCSEPGSVELWLRQANGKLAPAESYTVGYSPVSIAAGDLRGSGHLDLVIANACGADSSCKSRGTASLLFGGGNGKFTDGGDIVLGAAPSAIAIGSLTGKGLDLVVAERGSDRIAVLHGDGKGGFGEPVTYKAGVEPAALAIASLDGDGRMDVAVANFKDSTVGVLRGNADGTLAPAVNYAVGAGPESMVPVSGKSGPSGLVTANGNAGATPMGADITLLSVHRDALPAPTVKVTAIPSPAIVEQTEVLTAVVGGTAGTPPASTVAFTSTITASIVCAEATAAPFNTVTITNTDMTAGTATVTCTTTSLEGGADTITAAYAGDGVNYGPKNGTVSLTIDPGNATTSVGTSANGSAVDSAVTFTANVSVPSGAGILLSSAGTVTFSDNGNPITVVSTCGTAGVVTITPNASNTAGTATCTTSGLTAGNHAIVATYGGDTNYTGTGTFTQNVRQATTISIVTAQPSNSAVNGPVNLMATVTPNTPVAPTGEVTFFESTGGVFSAVSGCQVGAGVRGIFTCQTSALTVGVHQILATYSGDDNFDTSTSLAFAPVNVFAGNASLALTSTSTAPFKVNQALGFKVTLSPTNTGPIPYSGLVTISDSITGLPIPSCTGIVVGASGVATCQTSALTATAHTLTAAYSNDPNFTASPTTLMETVATTTTTVAFTPAILPVAQVNQPVTFTVQVSPTIAGPTPITGKVSFTDNAAPIPQCSGLFTSALGIASCTDSGLTAGAHTIMASFGNDSNYQGNNGSVSQSVNAATTTLTTLTTSGTPSQFNFPVTFTATVSTPAGNVPLSGTISFFADGSAAPITGCATVPILVSIVTNSQGSNQVGTAACVTSTLSVATHSITASYSGGTNLNFTGSNDSLTPLTQKVVAASNTILLTSSTGTTASSVNQIVTFTASMTVPSSSSVLKGTVDFTDNSQPISPTCSAAIPKPQGTGSTTWIATCIDPGLTASPMTGHSIQATYNNDSNFQFLAGSLTQLVNAATTSLAVTVPNSSTAVDQPVPFTAILTYPSGSFSPVVPPGTVTFTDGSNPIAACTNLTLQGAPQGIASAVCVTSALTIGSHTVHAYYNEFPAEVVTTNFLGSNGSVPETITSIAEPIALTPSTKTSTVNQNLQFTAVLPVLAGAPALISDVNFFDSVTQTSLPGCSAVPPIKAPAPALQWTATCTVSTLVAGGHTITASYPQDQNHPDPNFNFKAGSTFVSLSPAPLFVTVSSSPKVAFSSISNPDNYHDLVTVTAIVTLCDTTKTPQCPVSDAKSPVALSGNVTFVANQAPIACQGQNPVPIVPVSGTVTGIVTCATTTLTPGADTITASYGNDSNFSPGSGSSIQSVEDYSIGITSVPPLTLSQGFTNQSDLFSPQTVSLVPTSTQGFATEDGKPLKLRCTVLNAAAETVTQPACKLSVPGQTTAVDTLAVVSGTSGVAQPVLNMVIDATSANAKPGQYTVNVEATDPTTGIVRATSVKASVRPVTAGGAGLTVVSGQTTKNSANVTFVLPEGTQLTLAKNPCKYIAGTGITSTTEPPDQIDVSCSIPAAVTLGSLTSTAPQTVTVAVTVNTGSQSASNGMVRETNLLVAGVFGVPVLGLFGLLRRRRDRKSIFRLLSLFVVFTAILQVAGCGGSFHSTTTTPPVTSGLTPPGTYYLLVEGTASNASTNNAGTYDSVLEVVVSVL